MKLGLTMNAIAMVADLLHPAQQFTRTLEVGSVRAFCIHSPDLEKVEEISWVFSSANWSPMYSMLAAFRASVSGVIDIEQFGPEMRLFTPGARGTSSTLSPGCAALRRCVIPRLVR